MALVLPKKVPRVGFYYHYKHDPNGPVGNYAYEVLGINYHTETGEVTVNYRPLYKEAAVYQASNVLGVPVNDGRPIEMWMGEVEIAGKKVLRFQPITDNKIIQELIDIREQMY